ncbi:ribonuclease [Erythrobacter sp. NAP1]|uniref:ribonuclease E/G n=1 Tax=Erythrobacter sp. NAP1 TaxID=237727 RepID=UPI0000686B7B|nr:ribonuclease E/G [Erythrobacter sp. NAP1]EAQ29459.1 ribonuclease [Erythrobacter sp. NAP1]
MAEWLVEHGIGETRALLIENGEIVASKLRWPGEISAGNRLFAKLTSRTAGKRRGTATLESGQEVLVDQLPPEATEGAQIGVRITRAPIAERGRLKRAQGRCFMVGSRPLDDPEKTAGETRTKDLFVLGDSVSQFEMGDWEEVWHSASSGTIAFAGGEVLCSVTPAMTVIDIDGDLPPRDLALAAVPAIAKALRWFDIGGNIGIDFPTLEAKADRRAVDEALEDALADWSHERTSMNGFGFVQLVARLEGPSLLHRFATSRTALCARYAIRVAERASGAGVTLLRVHPALAAKIKPDWITDVERRTGRPLRIETQPGLALEAPSAQVVSA